MKQFLTALTIAVLAGQAPGGEAEHAAGSGKEAARVAGGGANAAEQVAAKPVEQAWRSLFNGKDLSGWVPKVRGCKLGENFKNTFRVREGVLRVDYSGYDGFDARYAHLFYKEKFSHYRLRLDYRFVGNQVKDGAGWAFRNSGVMIHSEAPETMELEQNFPTSIEVQLLGGTGQGKRPTANLCTPGTHVEINGKLDKRHCITSKSETFHGNQWVSLEVEVRGNEMIRHFVNGEEVMSYGKPQLGGDAHADALAELAGTTTISDGWFALQSESHPVEFRNIRIQVLEP